VPGWVGEREKEGRGKIHGKSTKWEGNVCFRKRSRKDGIREATSHIKGAKDEGGGELGNVKGKFNHCCANGVIAALLHTPGSKKEKRGRTIDSHSQAGRRLGS